jgi:hypothetical protein
MGLVPDKVVWSVAVAEALFEEVPATRVIVGVPEICTPFAKKFTAPVGATPELCVVTVAVKITC